jgi:D-3-phosphoglycerate dehydrogenase / 2-oxoglutarate reductase
LKYKVLIADRLSDEAVAIFQQDPEVQADVRLKLSPSELAGAIGEYDALVVRSDTKATSDIIARAKKLKVIGRAGVGLDNVDIPAATRAGIIVMNTPDGNTISAAEHSVAMMLALARNIPQAHQSMMAGKWERAKFTGVELLGKTLGVVGLGRIGGEVAKRAKGFGMKILGHDPFATKERAQELEATLVELPELLKQSDFISVHVPKTKETKSLIGKAEIELLKPDCRLINVARGGIFDEAAIADALRAKRIGGAALDVFEEEPLKDNPFAGLDNVVLTPHLGASTEEAQVNVAIVVAKQILDALHGRTIFNAVNIPSIDPELWQELRPYYLLSEKIGCFATQFVEERITSISITYSGEVAQKKVNPLTLVILKELLSPIFEETVNYVNAPVLAKERGIEVTESTRAESEDFTSLISLEIVTEHGKHSIAGTLHSHKDPRIVEIDGYRVDIAPAGNLLIFFNQDVPGMVGKVATILGNARINIASLMNGRRTKGGEAVSVFNVDEVVSQSVIESIKKVDGLKRVRAITL